MDLLWKVDQEISLRLVEPRHAEEIYAVVDANRDHIGARLPWVAKTSSPEELRQYAQRSLERYAKNAAIVLSILEHGRLVGGVSLDDIQKSTLHVETGTADIGYWLAADAQGRGIMTRSVAAVLDHAFDALGLFRVTIRAEPDNLRSCRVPQRLGFIHEGTLRHVCRWNDRWVDHHLYAILAENWRRRGNGLF